MTGVRVVKVNQIISISICNGLVYSNDFVSMFDAKKCATSLSLSLSLSLSRYLSGKHSGTIGGHLVSISMRSDLTCH